MEQNLTIGELLKNARSKKNVSLEDVASKTKININILRALEKNEVEILPNKTYVKGFVKNCAKTLDIETSQALKALDLVYQELEPEQPKEQAQEVKNTNKQAKKSTSEPSLEKRLEVAEMGESLKGILSQLINKKIMAGVGVFLVLFFAVKGIVGFFSSINQEKESLVKAEKEAPAIKAKEASLFELESAKKLAEEGETKAEGNDQPPETEQSEPEKTQTEKREEVKPAAKSVSTEPDTEEPAIQTEPLKKVAAANDGKFPFVNFYPAPRNLFQLDGQAEDLSNEDFLPEKYKKAMNADKHNIFINATEGDTWLSYQTDGGEIKRFVLKKGRTLFIQAEEVVLLFLGNLNAAKIFYNNQLVLAKSRTGVKSLIFPENMAADYELPLFPSYNGIPREQKAYKRNMASKPD